MSVSATTAAAGPVGASTGLPVFIDEVAFASDPFDDPQVWTDLTDRTRLRSFGRGRQTERDAPNTGTSSTTFENMDRELDSENVSSSYYPNVVPMRRIRCRATLEGVTYPVFSHFIDPLLGWQLDNSTPGYSEAIVVANDGFDILSTFQFTATDTMIQQTAGDRVVAILDAASWPSADRDIDTTSQQSDVQAASAGDLTGQTALDAIQAAAANDNGIFYIDGAGVAVYRGRHRQADTLYSVSQATFSDGPNLADGYLPYTSLNPSSSKIFNEYRVTRNGGTEQTWSDAASITKYGVRVQTVSTLHTTDAETLNYAQYRVALDKDPHRRYDEMVVTPTDDLDLWIQCLTRQIGDRITVIQSTAGGGTPDVRDMHIEAISATIGPGPAAQWTYRLSPAVDLGGWALGDDVFGLLGQATALSY